MKLVHTKTGNIIIEDLMIAETFMSRFVGLMGKKSLAHNAGLKIEPCNSIHTFFMNFKIDVVFVSADHQVTKIMRNMSKRRVSPIVRNTRYVIELNGNSLGSYVRNGDYLKIIE